MSVLVTKIEYDIKNDKFWIVSDASGEGVKEIVENVIRAHIGAGADDSKPNEIDTFQIDIHWDFSDDSFVVRSNTGNKGLTVGILMHFLKTL